MAIIGLIFTLLCGAATVAFGVMLGVGGISDFCNTREASEDAADAEDAEEPSDVPNVTE